MAKSAVIGNLRVNMGLDSAQFQAGAARVGKGLERMQKQAAIAGAAIGASMAAAATAMGVAVNRVIGQADNLGYVADRLGVNVEALQELRHAADRGGMAVQNFDVAFRRFIRRASEAALGTGAAKDAFKELGVSLKDSEGRLKSSETLLADVADAMQKVQDPAARLRLAFKMFDTDGAAMVNVLANGSAGLNQMREEARNLGLVLSDDAVRGAQAFKTNLDLIGKAKDGLVTKVTAHLLPALESLSESFVGFVNDEKTMQAVADGIGKAFEWIWRLALRLKAGISSVSVEITALAEAAQKAWEWDFSGARDAWNAGQEEAARILADMEKQIAEGFTATFTSQGQIQRRISAAFGDAGRDAGENFAVRLTDTVKGAGAKIKAAVDPLIAEAARIFEATRTPLEQYQAQVARLNEMLAAGAINQDTYNRAVAQAQDAFTKAEQAGKQTENVFLSIGQTITQSIGSAFQGLIDGSKKVKDVLRDLLAQLGQMLVNRAFTSIIGSLFGGGGFGAISLHNLPGFATGTNYAPGGLAWVGERGPELVNLPRGSQVIPNHKLGERGGGVNVSVPINIDATGADAAGLARVEQQVARLRQEVPSMIIQKVREMPQKNIR